MRMRHTIGITTFGLCFGSENNDRYWLPCNYIDYVIQAGGVPLLLPPAKNYPIEDLADRLDGLILSGGGDIDPMLYQAPQHEATAHIDASRDRFELALARLCIDRDIPLFAICRGMQLLNVARGGTLRQHIAPPEAPTSAQPAHMNTPRGAIAHRVEIDRDSHLHNLLGQSSLSVMSNHHQCVDRLGEGFRACAYAGDGVIEAMEPSDSVRALAIQWHPELGGEDAGAQMRLFERFIGMCTEPLQNRHSMAQS